MDALSIIQRLGTHRFIDELAATIAEVAEDCALTRKKGSVTVKFAISPGADDGVSVVVNEEIKRTPPVRNSRGAYFFALDGELHATDPRQTPMEFREVEKLDGRVVAVDTSTGEVVSVKDAS
jgi:hypothetical protein